MRKWGGFLFGFLLCGLYWDGAAGMGVAPRWALLSIVVPFTLLMITSRSIKSPNIATALGGLFLLYAAASLFWTPDPLTGSLEGWQLALFAGLAVIGSQTEDMKPIYLGAAYGIAISSALTIFEWLFGYQLTSVWAQPHSGTFFSPLMMTQGAVLVFVACAMAGYWKTAIICCAPAIIGGHSRGAIAALVAAGVVWVFRRSKLAALGIVVLGAFIAVGLFNYGYKAQSTLEHWLLWRDVFNALTWWGHGIGSFHYEFPRIAFYWDTYSQRPDQAHNDVLELLFEYGLGAVPLFLLVGVALRRGKEAETLILLAFIVEGLTAFPIRLPVTAALTAIVFGHMVGAGSHVLSNNVSRRILLQNWRGFFATRRVAQKSI